MIRNHLDSYDIIFTVTETETKTERDRDRINYVSLEKLYCNKKTYATLFTWIDFFLLV